MRIDATACYNSGKWEIHLIINYLNTIKYLRPRQIFWRICHETKKRMRKNFRQISADIGTTTPCLVQIKPLSGYKNQESILKKADSILVGKFSFLNLPEYEFRACPDWKADPFDFRLWSFNLNYFDYIIDLSDAYMITGNYNYISKAEALVCNWISGEIDHYHPVTWDSYVVSKRLINWINFDSLYSRTLKNRQKIVNAIAIQADYLYKNMEYHLGANHLVMDAKALLFSGYYLGNERMVRRAKHVLESEFKEQVFPDGGHYERSISYHEEVLQHFLEVYRLLELSNEPQESWKWKKRLESMFEFLVWMIQPNGQIPLLNDSSEEYPLPVQDLMDCASILFNDTRFLKFRISGNYSSRLFDACPRLDMEISNDVLSKSIKLFPNTGYLVIRDKCPEREELYFLYDFGENGPDYNLGHAHADTLSIVMCVGTVPIFTDSGTYTYKAGKDREYYRSTEAHNTVCIDNYSSSQFWSSFRTAERAHAKLLRYMETVNLVYCAAEHDGYRKVLSNEKLLHRRHILYHKGNSWIILLDEILGSSNIEHTAEILFHISPECTCDICGNSAILANQYEMLCDHELHLNKSRVSSFFNKEEDNTCLKMRQRFIAPQRFVTVLRPIGSNVNCRVSGQKAEVISTQARYSIDLNEMTIA
jgi:uncharacterized heparinase superfamily protein